MTSSRWPGSHELPLIGRDTEISVLTPWILSTGAAGVAVIEGEAGIGKSRLVQEVGQSASRSGFEVLIGQCDELERHRPFAAIAEALNCRGSSDDPHRRKVAELIASPTAGGLTLEFQVIDLFLLVAEQMLSRSAVLLVLEDVQWSDPGTIKSVRSMQRNLSSYPLRILMTARPFPRSEDLQALLRSDAVQLVQLGPLDGDASSAIYEVMRGTDVHPGIREMLNKAAGNPLFIRELVLALEAPGVELPGSQDITPDLRLALLRKIGFLGADAVSILKMASVLGSVFSVKDLAALMEKKVTALIPAIEAALAAGILEERGDHLAFRHDLLKEAVYAEIPRATRGPLHLQVARLLAEAGARPEQVADHYLLGAESNDSEAIEWLLAAADRVRPTSPSTAIDLYERAQQLMGFGDPRSTEITPKLLHPLFAASRVREAEELANEALARPLPPMTEIQIRDALGHIYEYTGRQEESIKQHVLKARVQVNDPDLRLILDAEALRAMPQRDEDLDAMLALAQERGNDRARSELLRARYSRELLKRSWPATPEGLKLLADLANEQLAAAMTAIPPRDPQDVSTMLRAYFFSCDAALRGASYEEGVTLARKAKVLAETYGFAALRSAFQGAVAEMLLLAGSWDDALAEAMTAIEDAREYGEPGQEKYPTGIVSFINAHRGDIAAARKMTAGSIEGKGLFDGPWFDLSVVAIAESDGDLEELDRVLARSGWMWAGVERAWRFVQTEGSAHADALPPYAHDKNHRFGRFLDALLARDVEAMDQTLDLWKEKDFPFFVARGLEMRASLSPPVSRVAPLEEAESIYMALQAEFDLRRVTGALRAVGVRRGARGKRSRPQRGWESLTPTEIKVAELVGGGLSNPAIAEALFVSRRTVTTHISSIFRKLGFVSRTELAAEFARRSSDQ